MAFFQSTQTKYPGPIQAPINADGANDIVPIVGDFTLPAGMASGDIVEMCVLPAGYVPVDVIVTTEALGTTMTTDCGILSGDAGKLLDNLGAARTQGAEFFTAQPLQTAGVYRTNLYAGATLAPTLGDLSTSPFANGDRGIGLKFTTVGTPTTGKKVRMTLLARPRIEGA